MDIGELNKRLAEMGKPAVNDTPGVLNPFTQNLWQQPGGKWVIASDGDRGLVSYRKGPEKPGGGADILTFDTKDAACDYLWQRAIRPRPPVEPSRYTPEERAALQRQQREDFLAARKAAKETPEWKAAHPS